MSLDFKDMDETAKKDKFSPPLLIRAKSQVKNLWWRAV